MNSPAESSATGSVPLTLSRHRQLGLAALGLTALTNLISGMTLLYLSTSHRLTRIAFTYLEAVLTGPAIVRSAETIVVTTTTGALLGGCVLVILGVAVGSLVVRCVRSGLRRTWLVLAGVVSMVNPLAAPFGLASVLLFVIDQTDDSA